MSDTKTRESIDSAYMRFTESYDGTFLPQPKYIVAGPGGIATELVVKWGAIAGQTDGEDSAGRSKLRLQTPQELVARAIECAAALWEALQKQGWIDMVPSPKQKDL
jgi:hypothetical protein